MIFIWVGLGGAMGSMARYAVGTAAARILGPSFPFGTLTVNVLGSFAIGFIAVVLLGRFPEADNHRHFLVTGFLGGFTTFSAFTWDVLQQVQRGELLGALLYISTSVGLGLAAVILGYYLAQGSLT